MWNENFYIVLLWVARASGLVSTLARLSTTLLQLARTVGQIKSHPHQYYSTLLAFSSTISYVRSHPWAAPPQPTMGTRGRLLAPEPKWISRSSQMDFSGVRLWFPRLNFPGRDFSRFVKMEPPLIRSWQTRDGFLCQTFPCQRITQIASEFLEAKDIATHWSAWWTYIWGLTIYRLWRSLDTSFSSLPIYLVRRMYIMNVLKSGVLYISPGDVTGAFLVWSVYLCCTI